MGTNNHKEFQGKEQNDDSKQSKEKYFEYLFNLYIKHQEQFQEVFSIITTIGLGWLAAECVLISVDISIPKWIIPASCFWAVINLFVELKGIKDFRRKIENEREYLIHLFESIYLNEKNGTYYDFFSMPNKIVKYSINLIRIECLAFAALTVLSISKVI